jgi:hypothetical protein
MKTAIITAVLAATLTTAAHADTFATAAVKGEPKGKTILTTDACTLALDPVVLGTTAGNLTGMRRAFYYTDAGATEEGCWRHDAGTVLLAWPASKLLRRWPIANFKLAERKDNAWEVLR